MAYFWNTLHQFNNYEQITFAMKTAIKINITPRHIDANELLSDINSLNTKMATLSKKIDANKFAKYVKTKFVFLTLHLIDLLYIIYK